MTPTQPTYKMVSATTHCSLLTISTSVTTEEQVLRNKGNIFTLCITENISDLTASRNIYTGLSQQPPSKRGTEHTYNLKTD